MSQAKTLTREDFARAIGDLDQFSTCPVVDAVLLMGTFKAALRACEMAGLKLRDVMTTRGEIVPAGSLWTLPAGIAKKGHGRQIPMHPEFRAALVRLVETLPPTHRKADCPVIPTGNSVLPPTAHMKANTLQRHMGRLFNRLGLIGCSSHSGRRTFTTEAIRKANNFNCSIRDVQKIVGHRHLSTTEKYIELSDFAPDLVAAI